MVELYLHYTIRLHDILPNYLGTVTTLPYLLNSPKANYKLSTSKEINKTKKTKGKTRHL
jgi:hypothetical protein